MAYKEVFWMTCDSTEQLRAEYGPFHTRTEAETEAKKLGFGYLLRYEHILGEDEEVRKCDASSSNYPDAAPVGLTRSRSHSIPAARPAANRRPTTRTGKPRSGPTFTNSNTPAICVRLFEHARGRGLKEIGDWRALGISQAKNNHQGWVT